VILQTTLTSFMPSKKRQTRTMQLRRSAPVGSIEHVVQDLKTRGWEEMWWYSSRPSSLPPPSVLRKCAVCDLEKTRKCFARRQCRSASPVCLECTTAEAASVAESSKRRKKEKHRELMEDFEPPLPIFVEIRPSVRHHEARLSRRVKNEVVYIYDGSQLRQGYDEIISAVKAGTMITAYASSGEWLGAEWLRVTCAKCATRRRDQWVRACDFVARPELSRVRLRCRIHD
jgi:hypothetical protein